MSINQLGDKTTGHSLGLAYLSDVASVIPPSNIFTNVWTPITYGGNTVYAATTIGVSPLLTSTSVISAALQSAPTTGNSTVDNAIVADGLNCWLITAYPTTANGGSITFLLAGQPTQPAFFRIAWAVVKF